MEDTRQKSASVSNGRMERAKADPRAIRTRRQLDRAFVELLFRRSYDNIRVSDITRKAQVGRATYYAHYTSKHDLLRAQFGSIVAPMLVAKEDEPCRVDATLLLQHVKTAPRIYVALMGGRDGGGRGASIMRECFEDRLGRMFHPGEDTHHPGSDLQARVIVRFVASTLFATIECWLEQGACESPEQVQAIFSRLVGKGLAGMEPSPPRVT